jgi:DNA-binding HxlR family transcriptional regulator
MLSEKKNTVSEAICPVTHCMKMIGGKWKPIIIYLIRKGGNRFGVLSRGIEGISKQMLTENLRELERDGVITRTVFAEVPPAGRVCSLCLRANLNAHYRCNERLGFS